MAKGDVVIRFRIDDKNVSEEVRKIIADLAKIRGAGKGAGQGLKEVEKGAGEIKLATNNARVGFFGLTGAIGTALIAVQAVTGAMSGAINTFAQAAGATIEVADAFEVTEKKMTVLTGSEAAAKRFFGAIRDFASETPYQVKELADSFNLLYPVFAEKTLPMMKVIGDTASGTGKSFEETSMALMRLSTGDWSTEILRQLFVVKSDLTGVFGPDGQLVVSNEEAMAKLEQVLGSRFGGMMASMMDTVTGKTSNLKDAWASLEASIGGELTPAVKEVLDLLIDVVHQAEGTGQLQRAAGMLAEAFDRNKDILYEVAEKGLPLMLDGLTTAIAIFAQAIDILGDVNNMMKTVFGEEAPTAVDALVGVLRNALTTLQALVWVAEKYWEVQTLGAHHARSWEEITKGGPRAAAGEKGTPSIGERIEELRGEGYTDEQIEAEARRRGYSDEEINFAKERYGGKKRPPKPGPTSTKSKAKTKAAKRIEKGVHGTTTLGGMDLAAAQAQLDTMAIQETIDEKNKALAEKYAKDMKAANDAIGESLAKDIMQALQGVDVKSLFADRLANATEAALSKALQTAMEKLAVQQTLSQIPIIGPILSSFLGAFDEGGITSGVSGTAGAPAGLALLHKNEAVVPLDAENLASVVKGLNLGLSIPSPQINISVRGTDPWRVRVFQDARAGAASYRGRVH